MPSKAASEALKYCSKLSFDAWVASGPGKLSLGPLDGLR